MRNISAKFEVCSGNYHPLSQTLKKKPYFQTLNQNLDSQGIGDVYFNQFSRCDSWPR